MTTLLTITGMRSAYCASAVYTALGTVEGVESARVVIGEAVLDHDERVTLAALEAAVAMVGYKVIASREL